jgi:hypothetical protein
MANLINAKTKDLIEAQECAQRCEDLDGVYNWDHVVNSMTNLLSSEG